MMDLFGEEDSRQKLNSWAIWVDVNRSKGRADPYVLGPDTRMAKTLLKALGETEYRRVLSCFLADTDSYLVSHGHALHYLAPNKYGKGVPKIDPRCPDWDENGPTEACLDRIQAEGPPK